MCGRFTLTRQHPGELQERFATAGEPPAGALGRFNVAPTEAVAVVAAGDGARSLGAARWGLLGPWARTLNDRPAPINARAETAAAKPLFSDLVGAPAGRVLVVADGWFEWLRAEDRRRPRQPFHYRVDGGALFAFAGLARTVRINGRAVRTVCTLTTRANAVCAPVHDRMPVILADADAEDAWLRAELGPADLAALCEPLSDARVSARPAHPRVNRSGLDDEGPDLLEAPNATGPPEGGPALSLF